MTYYILKLVIMLPLMAGMIVGALWLYRKYQPGLAQGARQQDLRLVEPLSMGTSGKLAVVEFGDQRILLSATRGKIEPITARAMTDEEKSAAASHAPAYGDDAGISGGESGFASIMNKALSSRSSSKRA